MPAEIGAYCLPAITPAPAVMRIVPPLPTRLPPTLRRLPVPTSIARSEELLSQAVAAVTSPPPLIISVPWSLGPGPTGEVPGVGPGRAGAANHHRAPAGAPLPDPQAIMPAVELTLPPLVMLSVPGDYRPR